MNADPAAVDPSKVEPAKVNPSAFDPTQAKLVSSCKAPGTLYCQWFDEAGNKLYGAGSDGALHVVDLSAVTEAATKKWPLHENYVTGLVKREAVFISSSYDRTLAWTDAETGVLIRRVPAHAGWIRELVMSADGQRVVTVGDDMQVKVWNAQSGEALSTLSGHASQTPEGYASALYAVAVSPNGRHIASGDRAGEVRVWDVEAGKPAASFRVSEFYTFDAQKRARAIGGIRGLAFSADGARLAISGIGQVTNVDGFVGPCRVEVWDWQGGKPIFAGNDKHQAVLNHVVFCQTAPWMIAAGGGDGGGVIAFWNQSSPMPQHLANPKGHVQSFCLDSDSRRLFTAGHEGFQIWQLG